MARRRDLKPEERELWSRIQRSANPLHPKSGQGMPEALKPKPVTPAPDRPRADLSQFRIGGKAPETAPVHDVLPSLSERLKSQPVQMDARTHKRMSRGKLEVEGRIDLHGLTLAEAHPRLLSFVMSSHAAGKRLVLVITGKGKDRDDRDPIPVRRGVLRHQVPQWLSSGPARGVVLQVSEAHRRHGGSGALYVYLRRK